MFRGIHVTSKKSSQLCLTGSANWVHAELNGQRTKKPQKIQSSGQFFVLKSLRNVQVPFRRVWLWNEVGTQTTMDAYNIYG